MAEILSDIVNTQDKVNSNCLLIMHQNGNSSFGDVHISTTAMH